MKTPELNFPNLRLELRLNRSRRRHPSLFPVCLSLPALLLTCFGLFLGAARAQTTPPPSPGFLPGAIVAMMPFDGKDTAPPPKKPLSPMQTATDIGNLLAVRPQNRYYRVLSPFQWANLARLKQRGKVADLRPMIRLLKASVIIGGWLEATPGPDAPKPYRLTLTLYDRDGQLIGQLGYDVDSPVISSQKFVSQATAFFQMLDQALHIPQQQPTTPPPVAVAPTPAQGPAMQQSGVTPSQPPYGQSGQVAQGPAEGTTGDQSVGQFEDREQAPLGTEVVPHAKEASDVFDRRPPWQQGFDLRLGYLYNSRHMTNEGSDLAFGRSGAHGLALHLEAYPLAFLKTTSAPLAGIGVRLDLQLPFWSDVKQVSAEGGSATGLYSAEERRVEFALRWHWNYWNEVLRPDFEIEGLFGDHPFSNKAKQNIDYLRIPPSSYRYLGMAFGARMFFNRKIAARAGLTFAKLLNLGLLATPGIDELGMSTRDLNGFQSYGPGSGWLWRLDLGASYEIWKGLTAGLGFFYEQNKLSFDGQGNILQRDLRTPVTSASDDYLGVLLTVGYVFRPLIH